MNSEITPVLERIKGTEEYDILVETESVYRRIEIAQQEWYSKSNFRCPEGCGFYCEHLTLRVQLLDLGNGKASFPAALGLRTFAPSGPTRCGFQIKTSKLVFA